MSLVVMVMAMVMMMMVVVTVIIMTHLRTHNHILYDLTYSYSLVIVPHKSNTSKTLLGSAV